MSRDPQPFDDARDPPDDPLGRLLMLQVEGELSPRDREELERILCDDPTAQARYARYVALHAWLDWDSALAQEDAIVDAGGAAGPRAGGVVSLSLDALRHAQQRAGKFVGQPVPLSLLVSAFVTPLVLLLVVSYFALPWGRSRIFYPTTATPLDEAPIVARLHSTYQPEWGDEKSSAASGDALRKGQSLHLTAGFAEIVFDSGARVILRSPSTFKLESANSGRLESGSLTSVVPRAAIGFKISTPQATVIDLGTEFGVEANAEGESHVTVFAGVVELIAGDDDGAPRGRRQRLRAGQKVRISSSGKIERNQPAPNGFVREMPLPDAAPIEPIVHWRMGEDDRGARAGAPAAEKTIDSEELLPFTRSGTPRYVNATAAPESSLAIEFTGEPGEYFATSTMATKRTDNWLLEVWARADTTTGNSIVVYQGDSARSGYGMIREGNRWCGVYGGIKVMNFHARVERGQWTHLMLLRHNGITRMLVNGVPMSDEYAHEPRLPQGALMVGGNPMSPEQTFVGAIDEIRLSLLSPDFAIELLTAPHTNPR